ncbi:MAG: hypothetical protein PHN68_08425 [Prolixibacteraceae bacterium]|nr:hypothetical protein [Prolixibacteraceae bacterium]
MNRKEKIALIKRIQAGEIHIVNGEIVDGGVVLIQKGMQFYFNRKLVDYSKIERSAEGIVILPENDRSE